MIQSVNRKDGITYTRKVKESKLECRLNLRISKDIKEKLKKIAEANNIKYNKLVRNIIEDYVKGEDNGRISC